MPKTQHLDRALRALLPALLPWGLGLLAAATQAAGLPATRVTDVADTLHGTVVRDPYRWLEDVRSPEVLPGERIYYLKRRPAGASSSWCCASAWRVPSACWSTRSAWPRPAGVPHAINYFMPVVGRPHAGLRHLGRRLGRRLAAPDGRGQRQADWRADPARARAHVSWTPDSRHLAFNQVRDLPAGAPETETFLDTTVFLLKVGQAGAARAPLFGPLVQTRTEARPARCGRACFAPCSAYMVARTTDTTVPEGKLFVAPVAALAGAASLAADLAGRPTRSPTCPAARRPALPAHLCRRAARPVIALDLRHPDAGARPHRGRADARRAARVRPRPRGVYTEVQRLQHARDAPRPGGHAA
jgi:prolyl oligopeptidase